MSVAELSHFDAVPAALARIETDGSLTWLNTAARAFFQDLLNAQPNGALPPADLLLGGLDRPDAAQLHDALATSEPQNLTLRWRTPDGAARWLAINLGAPDRAGAAVLAHIRDTTIDVASRDVIASGGDMLHHLEVTGQIGLWWWYPGTDQVHWSDGTLTMLGLEPDFAPDGREGAFHFCHPADVPGIEARMNRAAEYGEPFVHNIRVMRGDGTTRHVRVRAESERDEAGAITCVYGIVQDIHEEVEAHSALRRSEERYVRTVRGSGIGLWDLEIERQRVHASASFMTMLGYEARDSLLDFDFFISHIDRDDRPAFLEAMTACLQHGGGLRSDFRMRTRSGTTLWARVMAETRPDDSGRPVRVSGSLLDVTLEKSGQIALETANAKLTHLVDSCGAILYTAHMLDSESSDPDLLLASVSGSLHEILGQDMSDLAEHPVPLSSVLHPDDMASMREKLTRLEEAGRVIAQYRVRHRDGRWRWLRDDMRLVRNPVHGQLEIIGCAVDFTSAKETERALIEARNAAQSANKAKSDFLAMMSHEIRTPMNAVLGMLDLLRVSELDAKQTQQVTLAEESARNLLGILNDILDFSKLDAGRVTLERIEFDPRRTIDSILSIMRPKAEEKGLSLEVIVDPGIPDVLSGDPGRMRQILLNLVSNAIKFTETGGVQVVAMLKRREGDKAIVGIEVTDTGIGIAEETRQRLFSRFEQADSSIKRRFGGTGLGLAISRQLCELMDGTIGVDSALDEGSTFWLELPFKEIVGARVPPPAPSPPPPAPDEIGPSLRVLVAEDNSVNQTVVATILEKLGHDCTLARNGREAIELLRGSGPFDLVLMDIQMPVMDGLTAAKVIRVLPGDISGIPIIALTANAMAGDREAYLAAGFTNYLAKPIDIARLQAVIAATRVQRTGASFGSSHSAPEAGPAQPLPPRALCPAPVSQEPEPDAEGQNGGQSGGGSENGDANLLTALIASLG